ncbi:MAG: VTT domain-containing protein [Oscillospiraceae bacterium]|nr:VTT domain-containing protein [Oscillospiraceae bacterium]
MDKKRKIKIFKIVVFVIFALIFAAATVVATLWVFSLREPDKLAAFQDMLSSLGIWGFFVLVVIQYVQIVIAFIPGGPIQIAAGALYGPLGGLVICLGGTFLASLTVFFLVKRFGSKVISFFVDEGDITKYKFLSDSKRLELLVVILFFIPGTPKDALTYLFALTPIRTGRFMFLSIMARLPAMITSIFAGDSITNGEWTQALVLFIIITVIGALGVLVHRKVIRHFSKDPKA